MFVAAVEVVAVDGGGSRGVAVVAV